MGKPFIKKFHLPKLIIIIISYTLKLNLITQKISVWHLFRQHIVWIFLFICYLQTQFLLGNSPFVIDPLNNLEFVYFSRVTPNFACHHCWSYKKAFFEMLIANNSNLLQWSLKNCHFLLANSAKPVHFFRCLEIIMCSKHFPFYLPKKCLYTILYLWICTSHMN